MPKIGQRISSLFKTWASRSMTTTNRPLRMSQHCLAHRPHVNGGDLFEGQIWGWDGIDRQAILQGLMYNGPTFANEWSPNEKSFVEIFVPNFLKDITVNTMSNVLLVVNAVWIT